MKNTAYRQGAYVYLSGFYIGTTLPLILANTASIILSNLLSDGIRYDPPHP